METSLLLIVWIAALAGQQQPAPAEPAHKVYVLTGCLEAGDAPSAFRLTNGSAVGQPPPQAQSAKPGIYLLQPVTSVGQQGISRERLQVQTGARVQVTVRPVEVLPDASTPSVSTDSKAKPAEPVTPRYTVTEIKRVADSCS
jgi:hypothetical protein